MLSLNMSCRILKVLVFSVVVACVAGVGRNAAAAPSNVILADGRQTLKLAGHVFSIGRSPGYEGYVLRANGKALHQEFYMAFNAMRALGNGDVVVVGETSSGGNACNVNRFVVHARKRGPVSLLGPVEPCYESSWEILEDRVLIWADARAGIPGKRWLFTPAAGLKAQAPVQHKPDPKLGWKELEAREVAHVLDLFDFEPVAKLLYARMGDDRKRVLQHFHDMSAAASAVDGLILMFGYKKANFPSGVRVIVDLKRRDVYMTWEHGPSHKLQVRPDRSQWPPDAARTLPERE